MVYKNPYKLETDEYYIWEILIKNDFEAFCKNTGHDLILFEIEDEITTFYIKKN